MVDSQNFRIQIIDPEAHTFRLIGKHGDGPGEFSRPRGVAVDSDFNIYVSDAAFNKVQLFDQEGRLLLHFGTPDRQPGGFQLPAGMHVDANDHLFVTDQINGRVQKFEYLGKPELVEALTPDSD